MAGTSHSLPSDASESPAAEPISNEPADPSRPRCLPFPLAFILICISAAALYFSGPGAGGAGAPAWVALIPFLAAIQNRRRRAAFGIGYLWGWAYYLPLLVWLRPFGPPAWLGATLLLAVFPAFFALAAARALRRGGWPAVWGAAALWVLSEQLRGFVTFGLSWGNLSLTQVNFPPALHTVSWWGDIGLSFLVALANTALWALVSTLLKPGGRTVGSCESSRSTRFQRSPALVGIASVVAALLAGGIGSARLRRAVAASPRPLTVGLVQANVRRTVMAGTYEDPELAFRSYEALTDGLARRGCRWVLWPESAAPSELRDRTARLAGIARRNRITLLAGSFDDSSPGRFYNALYCFGPDGRLDAVYHKRRIVPMGEFVPWRRYLPPLDRFGVPSVDLTPGTGNGVVEAGGLRIGLGICFESLFPGLALRQRRDGAELLAVATNDSYYGFTPAADYHAASLRMRAAETGLPAVQAASTGYSLSALPDGSVGERSELFTQAALAVSLPPPAPVPFWVRAPWLSWAVLLGLALAALTLPNRRLVPRRGDA